MAANLHEALLYERLPGGRVRCGTCQWRCTIAPGQVGVCKMRRNIEGRLYSLSYAVTSSIAADPIEKKPLFHFFPGSLCFSVGGWGCNFHCIHCQNWQISCVDLPDAVGARRVSPEEAVSLALREGCQGISWTYNEPSVFFEYTVDSARIAKEKGLYTVYVTNGYLSPEALDVIGPYLDAWRVDVKGFTDTLYQRLAKVKSWRGILDVARRAKEKWDMHVEVVTNIIPTMNDDPEQLTALARWIRDDMGELTPWHVTRFYPQYQLSNLPPTPVSTLEQAVEIGHQAGLRFVYTGNVPGHPSENTVCYNCGNTVIERAGYRTKIIKLDGPRCGFCGADVNIRTSAKGRS